MSGTNIEAPLSAIEQAVDNVLTRRGLMGGGTTKVDVNFSGSLAELARVLQPGFDGYNFLTQKQNQKEELTTKVKVAIDTSEVDVVTKKVERLNELLREASALENELASREITLTVKVES